MSAPIVYPHEFRSSPRSFKAQLLGRRMASVGLVNQYVYPILPLPPHEAVAETDVLIAELSVRDDTKPALTGLPLGGFYAAWLTERHEFRAAILNPATHSERDLTKYVGKQPLWHGGSTIRVRPHHPSELRALVIPAITQPERYYLLAATGDEVLDYREVLGHSPDAATHIIGGGDHGTSGFAQYMNKMLVLCGVPADLLAAHPFCVA